MQPGATEGESSISGEKFFARALFGVFTGKRLAPELACSARRPARLGQNSPGRIGRNSASVVRSFEFDLLPIRHVVSFVVGRADGRCISRARLELPVSIGLSAAHPAPVPFTRVEILSSARFKRGSRMKKWSPTKKKALPVTELANICRFRIGSPRGRLLLSTNGRGKRASDRQSERAHHVTQGAPGEPRLGACRRRRRGERTPSGH